MKRILLSIEGSQWEQAREMAHVQRQGLNAFIRSAITRHLEELKGYHGYMEKVAGPNLPLAVESSINRGANIPEEYVAPRAKGTKTKDGLVKGLPTLPRRV